MSNDTHTEQSTNTFPPRRKQQHTPKNNCIIFYTIGVCLSCLYLQTQIFQPILNDRKAYFMSLLTFFDVFMCLWSYIQTIRIKNKVPSFTKTLNIEYENQKFFDYEYDLTRKNCEICNQYKFPRVSHCSTCKECIYKMDHHCVWTQTCIGYSNQKSFYLFCFYMSIGVFQFWYFTIRIFRESEKSFFELMQPGVCILWAFTAFSAFFVGMMILILWITHSLMILTNFRTLDGMKTKECCPLPFISTKNNVNNINLFDRGEIQNFKSIFGSSWITWPFPFERQIENQFYVEPLTPHPDKLSLMKHTNLYQIEQKYCKYMDNLSSQIGKLFIGKRIRVNTKTYIIESTGQLQIQKS